MAELDEIPLIDGAPSSGTGEVPTLAPIRDALGIITSAKEIDPDAAGANINELLRGILQKTIDGIVAAGQALTADSLCVTNSTDRALAAALDTSKLANGAAGTMLTPTFAAISCSSSGNNAIVAADATKKIRVLQWIVTVAGAVNFKWRSASTDKTGLFYGAAAGSGAGGSFSPVGHFETVANEALNLNLSAAVAVGGYVVYVLV